MQYFGKIVSVYFNRSIKQKFKFYCICFTAYKNLFRQSYFKVNGQLPAFSYESKKAPQNVKKFRKTVIVTPFHRS